MRKQIGIALACVCIAFPASAVVVTTGDGTSHATPPEDDPGFANVGILAGGSAIYLGNRWVMSASHVGIGDGTVEFGGERYRTELGPAILVPNPPELNLNSSMTDIRLIRLEEEPPLPALRLPCDPINITSEVVMIGAGRTRESEMSYWRVTAKPGRDNDEWRDLPTSAGANRRGWLTNDERVVRWGSNLVSRTSFSANSAHGDVESFETSFSENIPVDGVAQAVRGDSGGAVFQKNEDVWELVGLIHAVSEFENPPDNVARGRAAIFGQVTFSADLHAYAEAIRDLADFEPLMGDINGDGELTALDIDAIQAALLAGHESCHYDLTGDSLVDTNDRDAWLHDAGTLIGDADLDGHVGFADFVRLSRAYAGPGGWEDGDFDGDGEIAFGDFLELSRHFGDDFVGTPGDAVMAAAVPEPDAAMLFVCCSSLLAVLRRRCCRTCRER